jgi:hypothetical protein
MSALGHSRCPAVRAAPGYFGLIGQIELVMRSVCWHPHFDSEAAELQRMEFAASTAQLHAS